MLFFVERFFQPSQKCFVASASAVTAEERKKF